ncbi:undecaprenyldiphospho-muramoylpentapeptide beta-N-acetylglucosaminyltransferase [Emcibacter sp. SYSU 3D8]|uniref:undecaprenyldiphospho-muramoylpentapeptide beta-N-acetylglucosaminyltransferase n=1 Tax=Emcibacter sp. SYSU 3D8 TaxID=3133969 RepID=UPI0031FEB20B
MIARPPRIVLAAGGTGGHMFPALAVAEVLKRRGVEPVLVTDDRGERYAAPFGNIDKHVLPAANVTRNKLTGAVNLVRATSAARKLLADMRPVAVMGLGGYATLPALIAARLRRIPTCIHEQNAVLGRVNRLSAGFIDRIALSFADTQRLAEGHRAKSVVTGNPVRAEVVALAGVPYGPPGDGGAVRLLVLGGSQGASVLSEVVPPALARLPEEIRARLQVTQQCRPEDIDSVRDLYARQSISSELAPFFTDVAARLVESHIVIARAGASTISELEVTGRPSILVPLPGAMDDHQTANAASLAASGGAWVIPQPGFTAETVSDRIEALVRNPDALAVASAAARGRATLDAAERLADLVLELANQRLDSRAASTAEQPPGTDNLAREWRVA